MAIQKLSDHFKELLALCDAAEKRELEEAARNYEEPGRASVTIDTDTLRELIALAKLQRR